MVRIAKLVLVQLTILVVGLICIELVLRIFAPLPVHGGTYHAHNGAHVRVAQDKFLLKPNLEVTHTASEFSAQIRTNELGYRKLIKESITPRYVFLGDSFTFGHGVSNEETFVQIFCAGQDVACLNLGRPGTNTFDQLRVLKYALDTHKIRPKVVVLVMLTACWIDQSGNDLGDNLRDYRAKNTTGRSGKTDSSISKAPAVFAEASSGGTAPLNRSFIKRMQRWIGDFEITKRAMLAFSSQLKNNLYSCSDQETIDAAITATRGALDELEHLAVAFDFDVKIFSIHPYQELDDAFRKTQGSLTGAIPSAFELIGTGEYFRKSHYFPYDGHFNSVGHLKMAEIIENELSAKETRNPAD